MCTAPPSVHGLQLDLVLSGAALPAPLLHATLLPLAAPSSASVPSPGGLPSPHVAAQGLMPRTPYDAMPHANNPGGAAGLTPRHALVPEMELAARAPPPLDWSAITMQQPFSFPEPSPSSAPLIGQFYTPGVHFPLPGARDDGATAMPPYFGGTTPHMSPLSNPAGPSIPYSHVRASSSLPARSSFVPCGSSAVTHHLALFPPFCMQYDGIDASDMVSMKAPVYPSAAYKR